MMPRTTGKSDDSEHFRRLVITHYQNGEPFSNIGENVADAEFRGSVYP